jgi:hypothetical protein
LHVQGATLALLRDPSRLLGLLNANDVLHVGLHVYHAKRRADIAWPHGRGLAACFRTMGETHVTWKRLLSMPALEVGLAAVCCTQCSQHSD